MNTRATRGSCEAPQEPLLHILVLSTEGFSRTTSRLQAVDRKEVQERNKKVKKEVRNKKAKKEERNKNKEGQDSSKTKIIAERKPSHSVRTRLRRPRFKS